LQIICASAVALLGLGTLLESSQAQSSTTSTPDPIQSLKRVTIPGPKASELAPLLADRKAAIMLGKALFWDSRVGSDNKTACATCHFNAGADNRTKNQISPGLLAGDKTFQLGGAPNYQLKASDFPFTRHANINDATTRNADLNDIASSQGVFTETFSSVSNKGKPDDCTVVSDAVSHGGSGFNINGVNTRRVEPRQAPSVINAVFNLRLFWDGRANNMFNGRDISGLRNATAQVWKLDNGVLRKTPISLSSAALASLASGPPISENEMSCRGRVFANVGRKLLNMEILTDQNIDRNDSVLGSVAFDRPTYSELVKRAFKRDFWASDSLVSIVGSVEQTIDLPPSTPGSNGQVISSNNQFTQIEANFALFFGLAVQLYQSTLVSDNTPFDCFAEHDKGALNQQEIRGLALFRGKAECVHCHSGAEFTAASFTSILDEGRLDSRDGANGTIFRYDNGFFNTGVRPTAEDIGVGGIDVLDFRFRTPAWRSWGALICSAMTLTSTMKTPLHRTP
jgi:cytochrome c peroxidase